MTDDTDGATEHRQDEAAAPAVEDRTASGDFPKKKQIPLTSGALVVTEESLRAHYANMQSLAAGMCAQGETPPQVESYVVTKKLDLQTSDGVEDLLGHRNASESAGLRGARRPRARRSGGKWPLGPRAKGALAGSRGSPFVTKKELDAGE